MLHSVFVVLHLGGILNLDATKVKLETHLPLACLHVHHRPSSSVRNLAPGVCMHGRVSAHSHRHEPLGSNPNLKPRVCCCQRPHQTWAALSLGSLGLAALPPFPGATTAGAGGGGGGGGGGSTCTSSQLSRPCTMLAACCMPCASLCAQTSHWG